LEVVGLSLDKLLEFRGKLKEASELLDQARTLIAAMLITDDYSYLHDARMIVNKALKDIEEAVELARKMEEEVDAIEEFEEVDG
jgi:acyl-CoA reductase-like NAD-dependent aldehyde dehydrogenase